MYLEQRGVHYSVAKGRWKITLEMIMALAFDTLGYAKRLREGGIPQDQAEAHAESGARLHHG